MPAAPRVPSGSPGSGQERLALWKPAIERMNLAIQSEFWLEAVALQESLIADRLESLLGMDGREVRSQTLGDLERQLKKRSDLITNELLEQVTAWRVSRNVAVHMMAKLAEGHRDPWGVRLLAAQETAEEGAKLVRRVANYVQRQKRRGASKTD